MSNHDAKPKRTGYAHHKMMIRASELTKSAWKNGGGTTTEILRSVQGSLVTPARIASALSSSDYDWRISLAEIASDGPFSKFKGYDRALIVWRGEGLILNGRKMRSFETLIFSGDDSTVAQLTEGPVTDLGVIYKRDSFTVSIAPFEGHARRGDLVFVTSGNFGLVSASVAQEDTVIVEDAVPVPLSPDSGALWIRIARR